MSLQVTSSVRPFVTGDAQTGEQWFEITQIHILLAPPPPAPLPSPSQNKQRQQTNNNNKTATTATE